MRGSLPPQPPGHGGCGRSQRTFLERDVPGLGSKVAPATLGRFWRMLAHWHGQTWNASELARSMDVSPTAVNHYRDLLAGSFMIRVLPPWFVNLGKRLVKSPRVFLRDSGILHFLLGLEDPDQLPLHPRYGRQLGGVRAGADADCARRARGLLLPDPARGRAGSAAAPRRETVRVRVQVLGGPEDHEVHARRRRGPWARTSVGRVSGRAGVSLGRPDHGSATRLNSGPAPATPEPGSVTARDGERQTRPGPTNWSPSSSRLLGTDR